MVWKVARNQKSIFANDAPNHTAYSDYYDKRFSFKTYNELCVPIKATGSASSQIVGVVEFLNKRSAPSDCVRAAGMELTEVPWTELDQQLAEQLMNHVARCMVRALSAYDMHN